MNTDRRIDWPIGGHSKRDGARAGRIEDYAELRTSEGLSPRHAAERMGICMRTARRYEKALREQAASERGMAHEAGT